uniref:Uncharacterized protein n=1 Tax=Oryctolagus cuniculus TaxID=9986 RepID=A0A5F9D685_RABIT
MDGSFGSDFGGSGGGKLDPGLIMEQRKMDKCFRKCIGKPGGLFGQLRAEVHRHVHGPLHGCLEHCVAHLHLAAAAGAGQPV